MLCLNDMDGIGEETDTFVSQHSDESDHFLAGTVHYLTMDNCKLEVS